MATKEMSHSRGTERDGDGEEYLQTRRQDKLRQLLAKHR